MLLAATLISSAVSFAAESNREVNSACPSIRGWRIRRGMILSFAARTRRSILYDASPMQVSRST